MLASWLPYLPGYSVSSIEPLSAVQKLEIKTAATSIAADDGLDSDPLTTNINLY